MQAQRDEGLEHADSTSRLLNASPFFLSAQEKDVLSAYNPQPFESQRPSSTPVEHSDLYQMWIPPKRELPFPKPRKSSDPKSSSTPDHSLNLAKPTAKSVTESLPKISEVQTNVAATPVKKPAPKKRVAQRKATNAKSNEQRPRDEEVSMPEITEESIPKLASIQEEPEELSPLAAKSAAASYRPASAPGLTSKAILPPKKRLIPPTRPVSVTKRPKMVDAATQTQPSPARIHDAVSQTDQTSTPPGIVASASSPESLPESYIDELDAFITKHNRPLPKELWHSGGYAEADAVARQRMLSDFICENLDNADFLQLCQDAEFSWGRLGLGM